MGRPWARLSAGFRKDILMFLLSSFLCIQTAQGTSFVRKRLAIHVGSSFPIDQCQECQSSFSLAFCETYPAFAEQPNTSCSSDWLGHALPLSGVYAESRSWPLLSNCIPCVRVHLHLLFLEGHCERVDRIRIETVGQLHWFLPS